MWLNFISRKYFCFNSCCQQKVGSVVRPEINEIFHHKKWQVKETVKKLGWRERGHHLEHSEHDFRCFNDASEGGRGNHYRESGQTAYRQTRPGRLKQADTGRQTETGRQRQADRYRQTETDRPRQADRDRQRETGWQRQADRDRQIEKGWKRQVDRDSQTETGRQR